MAATAAPHGERRVYRAGGGRRIAFMFIFLLLLPFYASLPFMLFQRVAKGLWGDTIGLVLIAIGFTVLMGLVVVELLASIRTRVDIGDKAVKLTVPSSPGPTPKFAYKSHEIPYDQIGAIETRREVYGGSVAPVQLMGSRILTKGGEIVPLGFVSEANMDPALPYLEIARKLAERSGAPLVDKGAVRRSFSRRLFGLRTIPRPDENIDAALTEGLNKQHYKLVLGLVLFLVLLVGTGILIDVTG